MTYTSTVQQQLVGSLASVAAHSLSIPIRINMVFHFGGTEPDASVTITYFTKPRDVDDRTWLSWGVEPTAPAVSKYFCPDSEAKLEKSLVSNHKVSLEFVELLLGN